MMWMPRANVVDKRTGLGTKAVKALAHRASKSYWGILCSVLDAMIYKGELRRIPSFLDNAERP